MGTLATQNSTPRSARAQAASLQFFGASEDKPTVSPWFHPEDLNAPDFNAASYVLELQQYAPLESLSEELRSYLSTLKSKLVEVINEDYNDFVSLSTKLVNVDSAVLRMQQPLQAVGSQISKVQSQLQAELSALQSGLQKRQEIATARTLLELMQNAAHALSKVENLLQEIETEEANSDSTEAVQADDRCRSLERLASEISRLNFYYAKGQDLPFIQQMKPQLEEATEKLHFRLAAAFKSSLVNNDDSARQHCLLAYKYFTDLSGAEKVIRDVKVRPLVSAVVDSHTAGPSRSTDNFPQIMTEIADRIEDVLGPLLAASAGTDSNSQGFNHLGNSLLAEVDSVLADRLSGAMSPGVPDAFATNFAAAMHFLERVEAFCSSSAQLTAFRSCPSYTSYSKRWKLSIYFSTRFQEIAGTLESSISSGVALMVESPEEINPKLQLSPSIALIKCVLRALEDGVYIPSLADKFLRLLLQLIARYSTWIKLAAQPATPETGNETGERGDAKHTWRAGAATNLLASGLSDLNILTQMLTSIASHELQTTTQTSTSQNTETIQLAFGKAVEDLAGRTEPLVKAIVAQLSEECSANLTQLRGITAMYRMSARPPPSRPSHYVHGLLSSLKKFFELRNSQDLSAQTRLQISQGVVKELAARFQSKASELLDTLRKTESSLNRIRQNRTSEQAAAGGMTDIQKISMQLFLDVQELGRHAKAFDINVAELTDFQELWKTVAPSDRTDRIEL